MSSVSASPVGDGKGHGKQAAAELFHLSKSDVEIVVLKNRIQEVELEQKARFDQIVAQRNAVAQAETTHQAAATRQAEEEEKLRAEQRRIVERRKHLAALGGTRSAKLMEREIDISARSVQLMEQKVLQLIDETDKLQANLERQKAALESFELESEAKLPVAEETLKECRERLSTLDEKRKVAVENLEERVKVLYLRVSARYPGGAVAIAESASCRSCYRSLPAQTFNQVVAGSLLIQCPGCSRILVSAEVESL